MKMYRKSQQDSANEDERYSCLFYTVDDYVDALYL